MPRIVIYAYKETSRSARKLQAALDEEDLNTLLLWPDKAYAPRQDDIIIGWGAGTEPSWNGRARSLGCTWLNYPEAILDSVNKSNSFHLFREARVPMPFITASRQTAAKWLLEGEVVLARTETEGRDGSGLVVMTNERELVSAPLYTLYEEKTEEFRIHVWEGKAFWGQIRVPITDTENKYYRATPDPRIRTSSNGWTLNVYNTKMPLICKKAAERAIGALGLDFGAVDIGWAVENSTAYERAVVYETNTSPEISDRTCGAYVNQILSRVLKRFV